MSPINVAVAVIQDDGGRVLLSRRPEHTHQGGLWEFPGGKVEAGESTAQALRREIREELGIEVSGHFPLIVVEHSYGDRRVRLDVHRVLNYQGEPKGLEGQPLMWVAPESLTGYPMPDADRPICNAIRLPHEYLITGQDPRDVDAFLIRLEAALARGIRLVQLRAPELEQEAYRRLAQRVQVCCRAHAATLMLNSPPDVVSELNADGVHLNSERLMQLSERPLTEDKWVAASCHTPEELQHAVEIGVDFCVLSPVLLTATHPEATPLGWRRFQAWVDQVSVPVFALGGMRAGDTQSARIHGAQGIAAVGALWGS